MPEPTRKPPYLSAIGRLILVVPDADAERYRVLTFDARGQWRAGSNWMSLADARKRRAWLMRHHRKLAKERKHDRPDA